MADINEYDESKNRKRRLEISATFRRMGKSLIDEGGKTDDFCILSTGNLLFLISGLILKAKDMDEFNNLCSMFTAKNILDGMMNNPMGGELDMLSKLKGNDIGDIDDIMDFLNKSNGDDEDT